MSELTKAEAYAVAEMIEFNIFEYIRNDTDFDSVACLANILSAYRKSCEYSEYRGLTDLTDYGEAHSVLMFDD